MNRSCDQGNRDRPNRSPSACKRRAHYIYTELGQARPDGDADRRWRWCLRLGSLGSRSSQQAAPWAARARVPRAVAVRESRLDVATVAPRRRRRAAAAGQRRRCRHATGVLIPTQPDWPAVPGHGRQSRCVGGGLQAGMLCAVGLHGVELRAGPRRAVVLALERPHESGAHLRAPDGHVEAVGGRFDRAPTATTSAPHPCAFAFAALATAAAHYGQPQYPRSSARWGGSSRRQDCPSFWLLTPSLHPY